MRKQLHTFLIAASLTASVVIAPGAVAQGATAPMKEKIDSGRYGYTKADVAFVTGMIGHHAQAVIMAGWAPTHGAGPEVALLCKRIVLGQTTEIGLMQSWLRDRHEPVPDPLGMQNKSMAGMSMPGMDMPGMDMSGKDHEMLMPGMLTPDQMAQLNVSRGVEFDRLFLTYMIQHHKGALIMVDTLFHSPGAGQDDFIFKFAAGVNADQAVEIERMGQMLDALPPPKSNNQ